MNKGTRRKFSADFKAMVALEAIKNHKTLAQLSEHFEVNPITISKWKAEFLENAATVFSGQPVIKSEDSPEVERLYAQIGQFKVELDFLKKSARKLGIPQSEWRL
jgi:transposase